MRTVALSLAVLALSATTRASGAGSIQLSPTTVTIRAGEPTASFVIDNRGTTPITFSAAAFQWTNTPAGEIVLQRTDDLVLFPTRIDIAAGQTRRVRIGTRVSATTIERAYRITLEQVDAPKADAGGIAMRMRFSLPLFVQPKKRTASVRLSGLEIASGQLRLQLASVGALHVTPTRIAATGRDAAGATIWTRDLKPWYLLAGEAREHGAALTPDECRRTASVAAEAMFLEGAGLTVRTTQPVGRGACGSS